MSAGHHEKELDLYDKRILSELEQNARVSIKEVANKVGLSRNAVANRISRLEKTGKIAGYTIHRGFDNQLQTRSTAIMMIQRSDRMKGDDVIDFLRQIQEVKFCYVVSGTLDLILELEAETHDRIREIWRQLSDLPGIIDTRTSFVLTTLISRDCLSNQEKENEI
ncbi:MAG: AsnC family transcriptional regulator [Robiginitomaculum sp.]|nr:MAG: AsnC family transcriptional regulator [Robiginitomaculum sp.]